MNELPIPGFQKAIRATHGADSRLVKRVPVVEDFQGERVWEGEVLVFELQGHPSASRCYAWEVDGRVTAVLHTGPVDSPVKAVRASILAGEPPRLTPEQWILVGTRDAVVCREHAPGRAEVVYLDDSDRAINENVAWADGRWKFEKEGVVGGYADRYERLSEFVRALRRGRPS